MPGHRPDRSLHRTLVLRCGAAQCSAPARASLQLSFGGMQSVCPSLTGTSVPDTFAASDLACWNQRVAGAGPAGRLLYTANDAHMVVRLPLTVNASCNERPVAARYQFYLIACRPGALECTDEQIACPSAADASSRWWEGFAETLAASELSEAPTFSTSLHGLFVGGRTIHAVAHAWEPEGSKGVDGSHVLCLSRTKVDLTPPVSPGRVVA